MFDLFLSEWRRYQILTLSAAFIHFALQLAAYLSGVRLLDMNSSDQISLALLYMAATLLFSVMQLSSYRPANRRIWLMHRPQSRLAIFGGLALAGSAQIGLVIGLPLMLTVLGTDLLTATSADLRHYLAVLVVTELCLMAWLVVAAVLLGRMLVGAASALLPFLLLSHQAPASIELLCATLTLVLMFMIAFEGFKPDRHAPPSGATNLIAAVPLYLGTSVVLVVASTFVLTVIERALGLDQIIWHVPAGGGLEEVQKLEPKKRMQVRLSLSNHPRREVWQAQLTRTPLAFVGRDYFDNPIRQQLSNIYQPGPFITADRVHWRFDHDRMLFTGVDMKTGRSQDARGLYGEGDLTPFPAVPYNGRHFDDSKEFLLLPQLALQRDDRTMNYHARIALEAPERLVGLPKSIGDRYYAFTSKRLIVYQSNTENPDALFLESYSVPLPNWPSRMDQIEIAPLPDATLISMAGSNYDGAGPHYYQQKMLAVDQAGKVSVVQETNFKLDIGVNGFPSPMWMISPVLMTAALEYSRISSPEPFSATAGRALRLPPSNARSVALALMLASCAMAWLWLRNRPPRFVAGWMGACLMFGPAGLATLMVLHPRPVFLSKD